MSLFDRYIAVDWSAANVPKRGKDSVWIGEWSEGAISTSNPSTRHAAMAEITSRLLRAVEVGERVLIGLDFAFGYPAGGASLLSGGSGWESLWRMLTDDVSDSADNVSNRFVAAAAINSRMGLGEPRYWGHPWQHEGRYPGLTRNKPLENHRLVHEKRLVELRSVGSQPVWKLFGNGSVGSQSILGIPHLQRLRQHPVLGSKLAIWPFETAFDLGLDQQIIVTEIFPSLVAVKATPGAVRDQEQVRAIAELFAVADHMGALRRLLACPADTDASVLLAEEGWIVGAGHAALIAEVRNN